MDKKTILIAGTGALSALMSERLAKEGMDVVIVSDTPKDTLKQGPLYERGIIHILPHMVEKSGQENRRERRKQKRKK